MTSKTKATGKTRAPRGAGSLSERAGHPGTWRLRYRENGRTRETTFTGSRSAAAAELRRLSALAGNAPPAVAEDQNRTVGDLLDAWLTHSERHGRSARYIAENRRAIETRLRPALGAVRLDQLTTKHLDDLYGVWASEGLTGATIRRYAAPLRTALDQALRWGWIDANPAERATIPRGKASRETLTPTAAEVASLIRAAAAREDWAMVTAIRLGYATSARRGELAALRWSDVDLDAGTVTIARSADRHGNEGPTKTHKVRTVQLGPGTLAMLRAQQDRTDGVHVVGLSADKITDRFRKLVATTDDVRDGIRFHDERHAGASELMAGGIAIPAVAARLGHASPRTTMQVYAHAVAGADQAAAAIMEQLMADEMPALDDIDHEQARLA
jgi:integrase